MSHVAVLPRGAGEDAQADAGYQRERHGKPGWMSAVRSAHARHAKSQLPPADRTLAISPDRCAGKLDTNAVSGHLDAQQRYGAVAAGRDGLVGGVEVADQALKVLVAVAVPQDAVPCATPSWIRLRKPSLGRGTGGPVASGVLHGNTGCYALRVAGSDTSRSSNAITFGSIDSHRKPTAHRPRCTGCHSPTPAGRRCWRCCGCP